MCIKGGDDAKGDPTKREMQVPARWPNAEGGPFFTPY